MSNIMRHINRDEFFTPFDSLFDQLMQKSFPHFTDELGADFFHRGAYPKVDVLDYEDKVVIEAEIPGLTKDDLNINVEDNILTLSGTKRESKEEKKDQPTNRYLLRELKKSSFRRSFTLGDGLFDVQSISAKFENGLLFVEIPKKNKEEKKKTGYTVKIS